MAAIKEMTIQDMLRRIIEMDKSARQLTAEARERREGSAEAIEKKKTEVSENFISMARNRIYTIRKSEMADAEQQQREIEEHCAEMIKQLDGCYEKNRRGCPQRL